MLDDLDLAGVAITRARKLTKEEFDNSPAFQGQRYDSFTAPVVIDLSDGTSLFAETGLHRLRPAT